MLRGTKGIGKSVFTYWLIYKIVEEARAKNSAVLPTFLLISAGGNNTKLYELLSLIDGTPVVQRVLCDTYADYVLSDIEYDPAAITGHWNLNVVSFGAKKKPKVFRAKGGCQRGKSIMCCAS